MGSTVWRSADRDGSRSAGLRPGARQGEPRRLRGYHRPAAERQPDDRRVRPLAADSCRHSSPGDIGMKRREVRERAGPSTGGPGSRRIGTRPGAAARSPCRRSPAPTSRTLREAGPRARGDRQPARAMPRRGPRRARPVRPPSCSRNRRTPRPIAEQEADPALGGVEGVIGRPIEPGGVADRGRRARRPGPIGRDRRPWPAPRRTRSPRCPAAAPRSRAARSASPTRRRSGMRGTSPSDPYSPFEIGWTLSVAVARHVTPASPSGRASASKARPRPRPWTPGRTKSIDRKASPSRRTTTTKASIADGSPPAPPVDRSATRNDAGSVAWRWPYRRRIGPKSGGISGWASRPR